MSRSVPIVLLTTNLSFGCGLANTLVSQGFLVRQIVLEGGLTRKTPSWASRIYNALGLNPHLWLSRLFPTCSPRWLPLVERGCRRQANLRFEKEVGVDCARWPENVPVLQCASINALEPSFFEAFEDCLFLVAFTTILREHVFGASKVGTINWHPALLPEYRGAYVEFWQLYHGARNSFGYTWHRIDRKVDTGPILFQSKTVYEGWNPWELRVLNLLGAIRYLPTFLDDFLAGRIEGRPQPPTEMKTFRIRDLHTSHLLEYYSRCMGRTLP